MIYEFFAYGELVLSSYRHKHGLKTLSIESAKAQGFVRDGQHLIEGSDSDEVFGLIVTIPLEQKEKLQQILSGYVFSTIMVIDNLGDLRPVETYQLYTGD